MGEYEDRYPEAYGRGDTEAQSASAPESPQARHRDAPWQHAPHPPAATTPAGSPRRRFNHTCRGIGPRGYVRSDRRIYEDICDRLTENPFIDASDMEVAVAGSEVTLSGSVDGPIELRQAEAIAQEVAGVARVHNRLVIRRAHGEREVTTADQVNRVLDRAPER